MADEVQPLTDDERAELEALRAEKAAREEQARAARERAELEALRTERAQALQSPPSPSRPVSSPARQSQAELEQDRRIREQRERGARLMEPDEDLHMPLGQKIVLGVIGIAVAIVAIIMLFIH